SMYVPSGPVVVDCPSSLVTETPARGWSVAASRTVPVTVPVVRGVYASLTAVGSDPVYPPTAYRVEPTTPAARLYRAVGMAAWEAQVLVEGLYASLTAVGADPAIPPTAYRMPSTTPAARLYRAV